MKRCACGRWTRKWLDEWSETHQCCLECVAELIEGARGMRGDAAYDEVAKGNRAYAREWSRR